MSLLRNIPLCAMVVVMTGCASLTSERTQPLAITTHSADGKLVTHAKCSLTNDKGSWEVETPGDITVHRSAEDLIIDCKKDGMPDGLARGISRASGGMWGNIVFGGGIGAVIDHSNGSGYNYPDDISVSMGESVIVDRKDEGKNQGQQAGLQTQANAAKN
ncbi:MAG: hypothetical protein GC139_09405 [Sideroxydans sp.]|nr:hypothetical protein [Sideroxydans sp.]